jgi:FGGY-family pentulose kinase
MLPAMKARYYLGIDVGTGSARAGLFDEAGRRCGMGAAEIRTWRPAEDFVEQSSDDIWGACGGAVRAALAEAGAQADEVRGIGFDATCSLVALGPGGRPITVSPTGDDRQNVVVWMDHRALAQARRINETKHGVLRYVGGEISPEMETPKLLWLKENLPSTWSRAEGFFDLPDFLSYRATGSATRSLCTTVCKWTYLGHEDREGGAGGGRWAGDFFEAIGLGDLVRDGYARIGQVVRPMGEKAGELTEEAARDLGLRAGTPVAVPIIDAHAGGLGMLGAPVGVPAAPTAVELEERVALIGGTSTCHMAVSREPKFIRGVWGPYFSAMVPGLWLTEGGQSATGALIDHVLRNHARGAELHERARAEGTSVYAILDERLERLSAGRPVPAGLAESVHVLPDYHGNRSPRADPTLRGMVSGLNLEDGIDTLAVLYLATIQGIAHGTRHILEAMNAEGYRIDTLMMCGGDTRSPVFVREHTDITGCRAVLPEEPEAVLLGAAILGAVASGDQPSVLAAMGAMNRAGKVIDPAPAGGAIAAYHEAKHRVFLRMHDDFMAYRELMAGRPE